MSRRRAVAILVVIVGVLLAMSLSTILAGTETAPARYAQIQLGTHTLDIWRDSATHDLTFHWDGDNPSKASRYIPMRLALAKLSGGRALRVSRYQSSAAAWTEIRALFGVTRQSVRAALMAGSLSAAAPTAGVKVR